MKKTMDLLMAVMKLGFDREHALYGIDASLDGAYGTANRKPLHEEEISQELYDDILYGFKCEKEADKR